MNTTKRLALVLVPAAALVLTLSACGGGSGATGSSSPAPAASAASSAAPAPSAAASSDTANSAAADPATSAAAADATTDAAGGFADTSVDKALAGFAAKELSGAQVIKSAQAKQAMKMAGGMSEVIKSADISPASCKAAATEGLAAMNFPDDTEMAMAVSGSDGTVMFLDDPSKGYISQIEKSQGMYDGECANMSMKMDMGGTKISSESTSTLFDPAGLSGDLVMGVSTAQKMDMNGAATDTTTVNVIVVRGTKAVQVSGAGTQEQVVEMAKKAQDYWAGQ